MMDCKNPKFIFTTQAPISINGKNVGTLTMDQDPDQNNAIVRFDISPFEGALSREERNMVNWCNMSAENSRLKRENERMKKDLHAHKEESEFSKLNSESWKFRHQGLTNEIEELKVKAESLRVDNDMLSALKNSFANENDALKEELEVTKEHLREYKNVVSELKYDSKEHFFVIEHLDDVWKAQNREKN